MKTAHWLYWWRAVSTAYLIRPNTATLTWLANHNQKKSFITSHTLEKETEKKTENRASGNEMISDDRMCISVYIRRGDKFREMKTVSVESYMTIAEKMWSDKMKTQIEREREREKETERERERETGVLLPSSSNRNARIHSNHRSRRSKRALHNKFSTSLNLFSSYNKTLFFNSEDPNVVEQAQYWAKQHNWQFFTTDIVNRTLSTAKSFTTQHHYLENEYLTMILNLQFSLQCDAWICTLASNYCRVIDELRATIGGKANFPYADLSRETCRNPPCIGEGIFSFLW